MRERVTAMILVFFSPYTVISSNHGTSDHNEQHMLVQDINENCVYTGLPKRYEGAAAVPAT